MTVVVPVIINESCLSDYNISDSSVYLAVWKSLVVGYAAVFITEDKAGAEEFLSS